MIDFGLDDILKLGGVAGSIYETSRQNDARGDYFDGINAYIQDDYNRQKEQYDAYRDYVTGPLAEYQANAAAAASANANARAAAARANDAARRQQAKKANRINQKGFKQAIQMYAPFVEAGYATLPQMTNLYSQGAGSLGNLATSTFDGPMRESIAAHQTMVPIPMRAKRRMEE